MHTVRTEYCGLFQVRICDGEKMVAVVGPYRRGAERDRMMESEVERNREWAMARARRFESLGYSVECRILSE